MDNFRVPFLPDVFYHVYHHANGNDLLFRTPESYRCFLEKFADYAQPVAETYAFCLLPNHFHFLIRIRPAAELSAYFRNKKWKKLRRQSPVTPVNTRELIRVNSTELPNLVAQQFGDWLNGYSQTFNRSGGSFVDSLQRKVVTTERYFGELVRYIHADPVHHGFCSTFETWPYSSYGAFLSQKPTRLYREEVLRWFGGKDTFLLAHGQALPPGFQSDFD